MHSFKLYNLLTLGLATIVAGSNTSVPQVDLGYAKYKGLYNDTLDINSFYGLRFAAAPVGARRWRTAYPIEHHNNYTTGQVIDATKPGPQCVQYTSPGEAGFYKVVGQVPGFLAAAGAAMTPRNNSEDCLLLDVIAPAKPKSKSLPVVIQIHGGGYVGGNSQTSDGSVFVSYSKGNVVWVQIQYRLGPYGFLGAKEVLADGDPNLGLLDQRVAFDWVQRNIHNFGGDPSKVTIWGGSAGGGSVMNHLIINSSVPNPPFRAAMAEFPWWQPYHDTPVLETQYQQLLNTSNCSNLACLRSLPEDVLANATFAAYELAEAQGSFGTGDDYYGPYVDGKIIRDLPSNEFKKGNFHKVPLLTDHDGMEGVLFQNSSINTTSSSTTDLQQLFPAAGKSFFTRLYEVYKLSDFTGPYFTQGFFSSAIYTVLSGIEPNLKVSANDANYWRIQQLFGDVMIACPTYYMGTAMSDAGAKVWKLICNAGIYVHGAVGVYVLADSSVSGNATVANQMKDWYLSFVVEGDPNVLRSTSNTTRPIWPEYLGGVSSSAATTNNKNVSGLGNATSNGNATIPAQFNIIQLNDTGLAVAADPDASDRCDFFHSQSYVVRN